MATDIDTRPTTTEPGSRRAILAGALGGVAGLLAGRFGSADRVTAASGDPLILGSQTNSAGTASTKRSTSSVASGTALYVQQNGTGTALRGLANNGIAGFFISSNGTGVRGVTAKNNQFGVYGANDAIIEAAKTGTDKGRYIHPELYGKPVSKGIGALHAHAGAAADPVRGHVPA